MHTTSMGCKAGKAHSESAALVRTSTSNAAGPGYVREVDLAFVCVRKKLKLAGRRAPCKVNDPHSSNSHPALPTVHVVHCTWRAAREGRPSCQSTASMPVTDRHRRQQSGGRPEGLWCGNKVTGCQHRP